MNSKKLLAVLIVTILFSCKKEVQTIEKSGFAINTTSDFLNEYTLFGTDNFNGNALDTTVWTYRQENLNVSGSTFLRANVSVSNGTLKLKDNITGPNQYGGAQIATRQPYWLRYGYYEIRAKLCAGVGTSCAFWLQSQNVNNVSVPFNPAENGAEIDIFENGIASGVNKLYYSLHWNGYDPAFTHWTTYADSIPGVYSGFHTFALEWTPKKYAIYVDGILRITTDTIISRVPQTIIFSNGRGGFGGTVTPFPNPDYFEIDYINVYKRNPEVSLYRDNTFSGWTSDGLQPGTYTTSQLQALGVVNNAVSSLEVPVGWRAVLYDLDNLSGDSIVVTSDTKSLPSFNDRTSSIRITN